MAASSSTDFKLVNLVNSLRTLTLDQTKHLALQLGVELHVLTDIEKTHSQSGEIGKAYYIQAWLDIDTEASWKRIVAALKQIGMKAVAAHVSSQYLPKAEESISNTHSSDPTPLPAPVDVPVTATQDTASDATPLPVKALESGVAVPTTESPPNKATHQPISPDVDPESPPDDIPQPDNAPRPITHEVDPESPPNDAPWPIAPEVDPEKVSQAKATIEHLEDSFSDVMSDTCEELCEKESQDPKFFNRFRTKLLLLPIAKKRIHIKFFHESEDEIVDAKNVRKILAILSRYCDYRNYELLLHLVNKFCEATKSNMMKYCSEIESFELTTTIDIYLVATSGDKKHSDAFSQMVVKMDKQPSMCTLHELRKFAEELADKSSLVRYSLFIQAIGPGSVVVELRFPSSAVGWVLAAMTPDFLHTHSLIEVTVDGIPLTTIEGHQKYLDDELFHAIASNDIVRVASLLNSGADLETVQTMDNWKPTPLMKAAFHGHITSLWLLLERGVKMDRKDEDGESALMIAASHGETDTLVELIKEGSDIDMKNIYGESALMLATRYGRTDTVVELVKQGADIHVQNMYGDSALMIATVEGKTDTVVELIKEGGDIDMQNENGETALITAARLCRTEAMVVLLKAGVDVNLQNIVGQSALMVAAKWGNSDNVVILVKNGAEIHMQDKVCLFLTGKTSHECSVPWAPFNGKNVRICTILTPCAYVDRLSVITQLDGDTALIMASGKCGSEAVVEIVKAGADLNLQNNNGESALMKAARRGKTEAVVEIAKAGADLNLQDNRGNSALMVACSIGGIYENISREAQSFMKENSEPAAIELIKAGTNLDLQNEDGDTAVILATVHSKPDALLELVRAGADPNVQNNEGLTALMISVRSWGWSWSGHELTDILLTGKNINIDIQENSTGWSALFFAAENGNVNALQSLLRAGADAYLKDKSGLTVLEFATAFCEEVKDPHHRQHSKHQDLLHVCEVLRSHIQESTAAHGHHDMPTGDQDEDQDLSGVDQDPPKDVQDTPTADPDASRKGQDTPEEQDTSPIDPQTPPASQVTTPPTTTVTQSIRNRWNTMKQRATNLLERIDGRLRPAKKKAEREEQLRIMDDNKLREQEQAERRELVQAALNERKRRRARAGRPRGTDTIPI